MTVAFTQRREETSAPPNLLVFLFNDRTGEKLDASGSMATTVDYYPPPVYCLILPDEKPLLRFPSVFLILCHAGVCLRGFSRRTEKNLPCDEETSP